MNRSLARPGFHGAGGLRSRVAASGEDGFVLVIVMLLLMIALLLGGAALAESLASRSHANLDTRQRRALQAADAGIQAVLYRENELGLDTLDLSGGSGVLGTIADCLVPNLNTGLPANNLIAVSIATGGTCPVGQQGGVNSPFSTFVPSGDHDSYDAEFIPNASVHAGTSGVQFTGGQIVSIGVDTLGASNKVYARVEADLAPVDPFKTVEANHDLTFGVPLATVFNGTARAGHQLFFDLKNSLLSTFVGTNILGAGNNVIGPTSIDVGCAGTSGNYTLQNKNPLLSLFVPAVLGGINLASPTTCSSPYWFTRQPISVSSSKTDCPTGVMCSSLTGYTGGAQHDIYITNGSTLTLAPGDYVLCSLQTNGPINVTASAGSAPVRIFIDSPSSSRCSGFMNHSARSGYQTGPGSFVAQQGIGGLVGGVTSTITPSQVQVYVAGNGTNDGTVATSGPASAADAFFLYAPQSNVTVSSAISFAGTVIGYDVTMNTILYTQDLGLNQYPLSSTLGTFHTQQYVQCANTLTALTGTSASDTAGC